MGVGALNHTRPTLSVAVPNYNHGRFLRESLGAIVHQSVPPLEVIVIDDASMDDSAAILREMASEHPVLTVIQNTSNQGVVTNMNRLLQLAESEYICFAAADDRIMPGFFEKSLELLGRTRTAGLCSARSIVIDEHGTDRGLFSAPLVSRSARYFPPDAARHLLHAFGPWVLGNTVVYRRDALREAGGFDPKLGSFCDGFLHLVLALRHGACFIPEPLACWRAMSSGYASSTHADIQQSIQIAEYAATLMRTQYADLFQENYVRDWERHALYQAGVGGCRDIAKRQERLIAELSRRVPRGWFVRALVLLARLAVNSQTLACQGFLAVGVWLSRGNLARKLRRLRWCSRWFAPAP